MSSLGYPCHMDDFKKTKFAAEWHGCEGKHQLVFLHVPKTAGESVEAALAIRKSHEVARKRRAIIGPRGWRCAFKFSTARNPWARWESWYSFCKSGYGEDHRLPTPHWACEMAHSTTLSSWTKKMIVILRGLQTLPHDMVAELR